MLLDRNKPFQALVECVMAQWNQGRTFLAINTNEPW